MYELRSDWIGGGGDECDLISAQIYKMIKQVEVSINNQDNTAEYFRLPMEEAMDLIGRRRVCIHHGFVYVAKQDLVVILVSKYRAFLAKELVALSRSQIGMEPDDRVGPLLTTVSKRRLTSSYKPGSVVGIITPDLVPMVLFV